MAFFDETDDVYEAIKSYLSGSYTDAPFAWPNEAVNFVDGPYIAVELFGFNYGQQSIGMDVQADNRWDEEGQLFLHVMIPRNRGFTAGRAAAKKLADLFRGAVLLGDHLEFLDTSIGPSQASGERANYYVLTVSIDWRYIDA